MDIQLITLSENNASQFISFPTCFCYDYHKDRNLSNYCTLEWVFWSVLSNAQLTYSHHWRPGYLNSPSHDCQMNAWSWTLVEVQCCTVNDVTACGFCTLCYGEVGQWAWHPRTYLWCAPFPWAAAAVSGEWKGTEWRCADRHGQGSWQVSLQ